jgi:hemerythrin
VEKLKWDDSYKIGSSEIDRHHKHLFELFEKVHDGFTSGVPNLAPVLDALVDYAGYHFRCEEIWMLEKLYPGIVKHRKEHSSFLLKINKKQKSFHSGQQHISMETLLFLREWITNHILITDAELGKFLKERERLSKLSAGQPVLMDSNP